MESLLSEMETNQISVEEKSYNDIIDKYLLASKIEDARKLVKKMLASNYFPSNSIYFKLKSHAMTSKQ